MKWARKKPRLSILTLSVAAAAFMGCTIGARAPRPGPDNHGEELAKQSAREGERQESDFTIPRAESVGEPPAQVAQTERNDEKSLSRSVQLGHARVTLGARPPWTDTTQSQAFSGNEKSSTLSTRWRLQKSIWVGQGYLYQAEFTPDQKSVVTLSTDNGVLYHYDVNTGRLIKSIQLPDFEQFEDAEFAMGRELPGRPQIVVSRTSGTSVLDLESGKFDPLSQVPAGNAIEHSGRFGLYGVSHRHIQPQSGSVTLQWISGTTAVQFDCDHRPDDWALSQDGKTIAMHYYPSNTVELLDLEHLRLLSTVESPKWGGSVALSPDGKIMALGGEKLLLVSVPEGKVLAEDTGYGNNINDIRFTPRGDLLLVSAYDGRARSYALPGNFSETAKLPSPQMLSHSGSANVYGLGLSADARLLVTSSGDKTIKIWAR